jgi:pimeloyl-ACP methyl ester carboxylesterase
VALWITEEGSGPAVLFVHGGLGDSRLWAPVADALADEFRCIRYDLRFHGRSGGASGEWSQIDDAVSVLDGSGVERAALVGLSLGGRIAVDVALAHPERVWALAHVAGAVTGMSFDVSVPEGVDEEDEMAADLAIWAPLGADDTLRELWRATPDAIDPPERPRPPAHERLGELEMPTLVVVARHDPPSFQELGRTVAGAVAGARLVEIDSDHYLTLRRPQEVADTLRDFLRAAAPGE